MTIQFANMAGFRFEMFDKGWLLGKYGETALMHRYDTGVWVLARDEDDAGFRIIGFGKAVNPVVNKQTNSIRQEVLKCLDGETSRSVSHVLVWKYDWQNGTTPDEVLWHVRRVFRLGR